MGHRPGVAWGALVEVTGVNTIDVEGLLESLLALSTRLKKEKNPHKNLPERF